MLAGPFLVLLGAFDGHAQDTGLELQRVCEELLEAERAQEPRDPQQSVTFQLAGDTLLARGGVTDGAFEAFALMEPHRIGDPRSFSTFTTECSWAFSGEFRQGEMSRFVLEAPSDCDRQKVYELMVYVIASGEQGTWQNYAHGSSTMAWDGTRWALASNEALAAWRLAHPIAERPAATISRPPPEFVAELERLKSAYQFADSSEERAAAHAELRAFREGRRKDVTRIDR